MLLPSSVFYILQMGANTQITCKRLSCSLTSFCSLGSLGVIAMLTLSMNQLRIELALLCLMAGSAGVAIADVIIDACVTENSISHPSLAGDMQSLCGGSSSVGQLIGYMISGFLVHLIGSKVMYKFFCCTYFWVVYFFVSLLIYSDWPNTF